MKTEKEKMQAGETYYAFDPELKNITGLISGIILKEVNYFVNFYRMPILL